MNRTCAHCERPVRGHAAVGALSLCHPNAGLDCYHLVSLYKHSSPCQQDACLASVRVRDEREAMTRVWE